MATMTVYADASDGHLQSEDEGSYADARAGDGAGVNAVSATLTIGQRLLGDETFFLYEGFLNFDVSALPADATTATLSLWPTTDGSATDFTLEARAYDWGDTLTGDDWVAGADLSSLTLLASLSTSGLSTGQYQQFTSEDALVTAINAARAGDGVLRLLLCSDRLTAGIEPSGLELIAVSSGDDANEPTQKPRLVVGYELGPGERQLTVDATAALSTTETRTVEATAALSKNGVAEAVVQVAAGEDNRRQPSNVTVSLSGAFLVGTEDAEGDPTYHAFWRFLNVPIEQGSTVHSATVALRKRATQHQPSYWTWYGEASDNVTSVTGRIDTRPKTAASTVEDSNIERTDETWYTWDVTAIVQEIVNRGGWSSGNNLALIADGNGPVNGALTSWHDYFTDPDSAAKLTIQFQQEPVALTVDATAALQATLTRTVEAEAALSAVETLTVEAVAALSESGVTRQVQATAALSTADNARSVDALAALSTADNTVTVEATAALMATFTQTVVATAALSATLTRTVVATAALSDTSALTLSVTATAALSRPDFVIAPVRRAGPPRFTLTVYGPLPDKRLVSQMGLPPDVALSFGSELPGGWARLNAGVVPPALRDVLTVTEKQAMMLPEPAGAPAFGHVEIHSEGGALVWEGRIATRADVGGEIRGLVALGYGVTALKDDRVPALSGPAATDVVVREVVTRAAPLIALQEVGNPGVLRDLSEFAGMQPYSALEALADTGCGTCAGWSFTVYERNLRFFALHPSTEPVYHLPADGTVERELDNEVVYTAVVLSYSDLDGVARETPVLHDYAAEDRYGFSRVLPLSGGQMTPSAALAFARTELIKRAEVGRSTRITRDWTRGLELAGSSGQRPIWEARAGEAARVGDEALQFITSVEYDAQSGRGSVTLGPPVSTDQAAIWRRLLASEAALRSGRDPVSRTAAG